MRQAKKKAVLVETGSVSGGKPLVLRQLRALKGFRKDPRGANRHRAAATERASIPDYLVIWDYVRPFLLYHPHQQQTLMPICS
jgi:hypothetical protein